MYTPYSWLFHWIQEPECNGRGIGYSVKLTSMRPEVVAGGRGERWLSYGWNGDAPEKNLRYRSRPRLRAVSLFSWSIKQNARDTQMTTQVYWRRETGEVRKKRDSLFSSRAAAHVSRNSRLRRSTLARVCTPLTKSKENERLLAVYSRPDSPKGMQ